MADLKLTIRGNSTQCILSAFVFVLVLVAFIFVSGIPTVIAVLLASFGIMAVAAVYLNLVEMSRAKDAHQRIAESKGKAQKQVTVQMQKLILLTKPAPKYDEYLICALLIGPEKETYIYPFPREIDGSAPIRKSLRQKLIAQPITVTCLGNTGVISAIEDFSLDEYPTTAYRPQIFSRKKK